MQDQTAYPGPPTQFKPPGDPHAALIFFNPGSPKWLFSVYYYRWMADLPALSPASSGWNVAENATMSSQDQQLAQYIVDNGPSALTHDLNTDNSTINTAAAQSNLFASPSVTSSDDDWANNSVETWMAEVFHGIGIIDPLMVQTGLGVKQNTASTSGFQAASALNVLGGRSGTNPATPTQPVMWPANGKYSALTTYAPEIPDARSMFGYITSIGTDPSAWPPAGCPIFLQLGMQSATVSNVASTSDSTQSGVTVYSLALNGTDLGSGNYVEIDEFNYANDLIDAATLEQYQGILHTRGAIALLPKQPLAPGTYTVSITVNEMLYLWSFTVQVYGPICLSYVGPQYFNAGQSFQGTFKANAPLNGLVGGPYNFGWQQSPPPGDMGLTLTQSADGYSLSISGTAALPAGSPQGYTWTGPLTVTDIYYQQPASFPVNIQVLP